MSANLVEKDPGATQPQIPAAAFQFGMSATVPFQLYPPNSPQERLLYAILAEMQQMNSLLKQVAEIAASKRKVNK